MSEIKKVLVWLMRNTTSCLPEMKDGFSLVDEKYNKLPSEMKDGFSLLMRNTTSYLRNEKMVLVWLMRNTSCSGNERWF